MSFKNHYLTVLSVILAFTSVFFNCSSGQSQEFKYEKAVKNFEKQDAENPPTSETTFFVGSSTFTRWKEIPNDFAEFQPVNRGFGGSTLRDWNEVATARLLSPFKPSRVVLYCGGNDMTRGASGEQALERFKTFVAALRKSNPDVKIHVCAIHFAPVCEKSWDKFRAYNDGIKKIADEDPNIYYVDFENAVRDKDGKVREDLYLGDRLHLTRQGEELLIPLVVASIKQEIKDAAAK